MANTKTINFLPAVFQSETNKRFLNATLDQLVTEPNLQPISGYVGRKFAPGYTSISQYIREPDQLRADYQLEPSIVVKNEFNNEVEFYTTYPELLQKINYFGGNVSNQDTLWKSDYYTYNPRINADAFINFGQYYWLPNGPDAVDVFAGGLVLERTFSVYDNPNLEVYNFSGYGTIPNPDIILVRGGNYKFQLNTNGKKFWIQTQPGINDVNLETNQSIREILGVTNNGISEGEISFVVPSAIAQDFYIQMPIIKDIDLATDLTYAQLQGQLVSSIRQQYNGIDGQSVNLNGKYFIFKNYSENVADWTYNNVTVPEGQRYGIWQIILTPYGNDFIINLVYLQAIPLNNKVLVLSGIQYGNTEWYTNQIARLEKIPVITATLTELYYQNSEDETQYGVIRIVDQDNYFINVDEEIIGKKYYISPNNIYFTNGLKIRFDNSVVPEVYRNKEYYIEGVGQSIVLIEVDNLIATDARQKINYIPSQEFVLYAEANLNAASNQLIITTTDFPDGTNLAVGTFPNNLNSSYIVEQNKTFRYPYRAGLNSPGDSPDLSLSNETIGVTLPGVPINGTAMQAYVPGRFNTTWHYDTNQVLLTGQDQFGGSVFDGGVYAYTNAKFITANAWGNVSGFTSGYTHSDGHSKIIGFAADGYPIYGPFGYSNPLNPASTVVRMTSSYEVSNDKPGRPFPIQVIVSADVVNSNVVTVTSTLGINPGMRITLNTGALPQNEYYIVNNALKTAVGLEYYPGTFTILLNAPITVPAGTMLQFEFLAGAFIEDYSFKQNTGLLDQFNGRYCVTPDFPSGTYAYFTTVTTDNKPVYPYIIGRKFYGSTDLEVNSLLANPDYIVINRASRDGNPWSKRNRWFHKQVIEATAYYNNTEQNLDSASRANRPIIEFDPNLQLLNFGKKARPPVDLFDTLTTTPFLTIQGQIGYFIDGINLVEGMRIIFSKDQDPNTKAKIYVVNFVETTGIPTNPKTINLVEAVDGQILENDTVTILNGFNNVGKTFYYDGANWKQGQDKTSINQPPLFDVFDKDGISFSDSTVYPVVNPASAFQGTEIFSYKLGTGANDPVLGFPLAYKNFNNVGDILFSNDFDIDSFQYALDNKIITKKINSGFLYQNNIDGTIRKLNVWTNSVSKTRQMQDIAFIYDGIDNNFSIDIRPDLSTIEPNLDVYVNYKKLFPEDYQIYNVETNNLLLVIKPNKMQAGNRIDVLIYSANNVSNLGYYQIPDNLNLNAQNRILNYPTLGEMRNHIGKLATSSLIFQGTFPGESNLRDIFVETQPGYIVQHSAPVSFAAMFLNNEQYNFVNGLLFAQQEYTKFKNKFFTIAGNSDQFNINDPIAAVDYILTQINLIKDKSFPWFYSDMVPYGQNKKTITYNIFSPLTRSYEISQIYTNQELTNKAVLVYLNNAQLIYGQDYVFSATSPAVTILSTVTLDPDDQLVIVEYANTDANYVPETPTKLGLYPKFVPEIYTDYTYKTPQQMIKGHDGSIMPVFGDYRDNIILELEKRIYNNIKVEYSEKLVNIYDTIPGKFRNTGINLSQYNQILGKFYLNWCSLNDINFVNNTYFDQGDPFTYNYSQALDTIDGQKLQGSWKACFYYFYDCITPNLTPWEMLGFSEEPDWWQDTYGPAPYTSGNQILWNDLEKGYIANGPRKGVDQNFARPGLSTIIPVNENGELLPPIGRLTQQFNSNTFDSSWSVGQYSPAETAWRNSSDYPFALQYAMSLVKPGKYFALGLITNKYRYNTELEQYVVVDTNTRITQEDVLVNGYTNAQGTVARSSGYLNWIADYQISQGVLNKEGLQNFIKNYNVQLSYRMAGFTGKDYIKILAEQNSPNSLNEAIIIPDTNYDLILSKSTPLYNARYSAIIIERVQNGFRISGYDSLNPYFSIVLPATSGKYKVVKVLNTSVNYYSEFSNLKLDIPYGTEFTDVQTLANILAGYERYLNLLGFEFNYFDENLGQIRNFELSTREFLFWLQQKWAAGNIIVLSPTSNNITLTNPNAVVDTVTGSFYGSKVLDHNFNALNSDNYSIVRDQNNFRLVLEDTASSIGFLSINLVQIEHALIFDNTTQFNDIIYEPVTGARQFRLKLVGSKTGGWTGTLNANGFIYNQPNIDSWKSNKDYLKGDLVEYKGFLYSATKNIPGTVDFNFNDWLPVDRNKMKTGLLQNFARNAQIGQTFYNVDKVNLESQFDQFALSLIGFRNRDYLNELGLDDSSQVKFYQGFIKQKGTLNAVNALGQVTFNGTSGNVEVSEDWAFRVGSYGSLETNQFVEFVLDERYVLSNPTSLEVLSNNATKISSFYTDSDGIYKTSEIPWSSPFLLNRTKDSDFSDDILTAGFVNIEDVDYTIFDIRDVSTLNNDIDSIGSGSIIWVAKDFDNNWNIFRVDDNTYKPINIANALDQKILITTDFSHNLLVNDYVILNNVGKFNGFYRVKATNSLVSFTVEYTESLRGFSNLPVNGSILKLVSMKVERPSNIVNVAPRLGYTVDDKVWIQKANDNDDWAVYRKSTPWNFGQTLPRGGLANNSAFGSSVYLQDNNRTATVGISGYDNGTGAILNYIANANENFVQDSILSTEANGAALLGFSITGNKDFLVAGAPDSEANVGYVFVYTRAFTGVLEELQIIRPNSNLQGRFGYSVSMSKDSNWLYVGAPETDCVYVYNYDSTVPEEVDTISADGIANSFSLSFVPIATETIFVKQGARLFVPYNEYTVSGSTITFTNVPDAADIVVIQRPCLRYFTTLSGAGNSRFGHSVATTTDGAQVFVGAPYRNYTVNDIYYPRTGEVVGFDRSINSYIASADQIYFGGVYPITQYTKVFVNNTEQQVGTDWVPFASTWVEFISAPPISSIIRIETNQFRQLSEYRPSSPLKDQQFGYSVAICSNNCSLYVGAPYRSDNNNIFNGAVFRFINQGKFFGNTTSTANVTSVTSGTSIRIQDYEVFFNDTTLSSVVTSINLANIPGIHAANNNGKLDIISDSVVAPQKLSILPGVGNALESLNLDVFTEVEKIENNRNKSYDYFGKQIKVNLDSNTLLVASDQAATIVATTFDANIGGTIFDTNSTVFVEPISESGAVWVYTYLPDNRNSLEFPGTFTFIQQVYPNLSINLQSDYRLGSAIDISNTKILIGSDSNSVFGTNSGSVFQFSNPTRQKGWDVYRFQQPRVDINSLIKCYAYNKATQNIEFYLDFIDPAKGKILGIAEQELTYKIDYDPAVYNNATIDTVSKDPSLVWSDQQVGQVWWDLSKVKYIDYEQGSIKYRNTNWGRYFPGSSIDVYEWVESTYPPNQYKNNGGDGDPKYPNNEAFVTTTYIDPISNFTTVKYYFWVKNKSTLTLNQFGRTIPTTTIATYIDQPKNSGIKFYAPIKDNAISLFNLYENTVGRDLILHLDYAKQINSNIIHNEYALISETASKSEDLPNSIINKLIDSTSGIDKFGNPVPDPDLPPQTRYGIEVRPRQSMFVNQNNAVDNMVSYVNNILKRIAITTNLQVFDTGEPYPIANSGAWDRQVTNIEELSYINIVILPMGYKVLVNNDAGVSNLWTIYVKDKEVVQWKPNTRFTKGTYIIQLDRTYKVNQTFTSGSVFNEDNLTPYNAINQWNLIRVQSYKVSDYWDYIDWYADGFDNSVIPTYTINTIADISNLVLQSGDIVKVNDNGQGNWYIIQVFSNVVNTIGIESGTIQFKDSLYDLANNNMGFGVSNFDSARYDQTPGLEIRKIIEILRDDIFINDLNKAFVELFFILINYILDEQKTIDWAFKTSFINVIQKINALRQPPIYVNENQNLYRKYIEEVKPYRTTIREYIIDYLVDDNYNGYVTDFDVPPYYDPVLKINRSPSGEFIEDLKALQLPQYNDWLSSYQYEIASIELVDGGSGYTVPPIITITGSSINNDAVAKAYITNGVVSKIELLYSGSGYITSPVITISGGNGTGAKARANVVNYFIRNIKTNIIYDRYTYNSSVIDWTPFTDYKAGTIITYDAQAYLVVINFASGPTFSLEGALIKYPVTNFDNANDRVKAFYKPDLGETGNDLAALQSGIEYPGVKVDSLTFEQGAGFDVATFDSDLYDVLELNEDGSFVVSTSVLDSIISSEYTDTSLGIRPEDIIVSGGPYVYDYYRAWQPDTYYQQGDLVQYLNRVFYVIQNFTSNSNFSTANLSIYNMGPYASHAPEELLPGRTYDTLAMTVSTLYVDPTSVGYTNWGNTSGVVVDYIQVVEPGLGYTPSNIAISIEADIVYNNAIAQAVLDANGRVTAVSLFYEGAGYKTTPNVKVIGANVEPAVLGAVMRLSNAPSESEPYPRMEYQIFKDMNDNVSYLRVDGAASTTLAANLSLTDSKIYVIDAKVLAEPNGAGGEPGVVFIEGERIVYYYKDNLNNTLEQLRRGTNGTGARTHFIGNLVIDGSQTQQIIQSQNTIWYPAISAAGTITVTYGSNVILGTNTTFLSSLTLGSNVFIADGRFIGTVANIVSNTQAIVQKSIVFAINPTSPEATDWEPNKAYKVGDIIIYNNSYYVTANNFVSSSTFDGINLINSETVSNVAYQISANVTLPKTDGNLYTFYANTPYIRSNLWYGIGTNVAISTEDYSEISTESNSAILSDSTSATNGLGMFNSNTIQINFIKQGLVG